MSIDDRIRCMFVLQEIVMNKLLPSDKLRLIDKIIEEQVEIIIETDPKKLKGYE